VSPIGFVALHLCNSADTLASYDVLRNAHRARDSSGVRSMSSNKARSQSVSQLDKSELAFGQLHSLQIPPFDDQARISEPALALRLSEDLVWLLVSWRPWSGVGVTWVSSAEPAF
jgi:hypothetical protein